MANSSDNISKFFHNKTSGWLRLDTVARIYAAIMGSRSPTAFRICAVTKNTIDPETLQTALDDVLKRFPYFRMKLKFGLFWNFLQNTGKRPLIEEETHIPCREFTPEEPLFRVIYRGNRISLEFSHVLTDGIGGLTFTRSLIAHYFRLKGCDFEYSDDLYDLEKTPLQEETEDAFERYFPGNIPSPEKLDTAFHIKGKLLPRGDLNVITGTCNSGILLDVCRKFCVTVNDFLAAHYLWALYRLRGKCNRDIRLLVPVNLRSKYPSKTIRNFFLTVITQIRPRLGLYSFEEILKAVNLSIRSGIDGKVLNQQIARNVGTIRNPLLRIIPLYIKLPVARLLFFTEGNAPLSGIFSNLGNINLPAPVAANIERFIFLTSPNHITKLSFGAAGFGDTITMTFTSLVESPEIPRLFFTSLRSQGIITTIESNKETV